MTAPGAHAAPDAPPRPARRLPRRMLGWAGRTVLASAALLALVFTAGELTGWRVLAGPAERFLTQRTGHTVTLSHDARDDFRLRLWRGIRLQAAQVRVASGVPVGSDAVATAAFTAAPLFQSDALHISARWRDLWSWQRTEPFPLQSLSADRLAIHLVRTADGRSNWQGTRTATPTDAGSGMPHDLPVSVGLLSARDGTLVWNDALARADVTVRFALPSLQDGLQARATGTYRKLPVRGTLQTASLQPWMDGGDSAQDLGLTLDLSVGRAQFAFSGAVKDPLAQRDLLGRFELSGPSLAAVGQPIGVTLPTTAAFQMNGSLARQGPVWSALVGRAAIGRSLLDGEFQFDTRRAPLPRLSGRLHAKALWLADLGPTIGTRTADQSPSPKAPGRVLPDRHFDLPSLRAMNANVLVRMDRLDFGTSALQPMAPLNGHLTLQDGVLKLDDLDARMAQGRVNGQIVLDGRQDSAKWQVALDGRGLRLEQWVRAVQRSGEPPYASGLVGAKLRLTGTGRSTAELLASANGNMQLQWTRGQVSHLLVEAAGLDVAQGLGVLVRGDNPLAVSCGAADLTVNRGLVLPRVAVVDTTDSRVWLNGSLSLADERLALLARVEPKDWSPLALRAPLHIDGTLGAPKLALDKAAIAARAVPAALLAMVHPLAALIPLFDAGEREPTQDCKALLADMQGRVATRAPAGSGS